MPNALTLMRETHRWMKVQIGYLLNSRAIYLCGHSGILGYLFHFGIQKKCYVHKILSMQNEMVHLCVELCLNAELCSRLLDIDINIAIEITMLLVMQV
jgi:hypothetical protein